MEVETGHYLTQQNLLHGCTIWEHVEKHSGDLYEHLCLCVWAILVISLGAQTTLQKYKHSSSVGTRGDPHGCRCLLRSWTSWGSQHTRLSLHMRHWPFCSSVCVCTLTLCYSSDIFWQLVRWIFLPYILVTPGKSTTKESFRVLSGQNSKQNPKQARQLLTKTKQLKIHF